MELALGGMIILGAYLLQKLGKKETKIKNFREKKKEIELPVIKITEPIITEKKEVELLEIKNFETKEKPIEDLKEEKIEETNK